MAEIQSEIIKEIYALKDSLMDKLDIKKIFIFGSYARGDFSADSDIDVCIIAKNIENNFAETLNASAASALIDPKIEPLVFSEDEFEIENFGIIKEIKKTGVLI
jgi:predicted nucleotidyltransferase